MGRADERDRWEGQMGGADSGRRVLVYCIHTNTPLAVCDCPRVNVTTTHGYTLTSGLLAVQLALECLHKQPCLALVRKVGCKCHR